MTGKRDYVQQYRGSAITHLASLPCPRSHPTANHGQAQGSADLIDMKNANLMNILDIERDAHFLARRHEKPQLLGQQQHALRGLQSEADSSPPTAAPSPADTLDATAAPTYGNGQYVGGSFAPTPSPNDAKDNDDANANDDDNASRGWKLSVNAVGVVVAVAVVGWRVAWVGEL